MGAGASTTENEARVSVSVLERDGIFSSFATIDVDHRYKQTYRILFYVILSHRLSPYNYTIHFLIT